MSNLHKNNMTQDAFVDEALQIRRQIYTRNFTTINPLS